MPPTSVCSPAMTPVSLSTMTYTSPKRRRGNSESDCYSISDAPPSPSTVSATSLQEARLREEEDLGRYSPRTAVARRLGDLAIRGDPFSNYESLSGHLGQGQTHSKWWLDSYTGLNNMSEPESVTNSDPNESGPHESIAKKQSEDEAPSKPTPSPRKKPASSPRKKRNPATTSKPRTQRRSPPPVGNTVEDPLTWRDSEITGHDPTDPTDDGYGINGIGFKPTAAMAWARSQKRQRQMADWRSREAREARERRRERRDGPELDRIHTIQSGAIHKKVKFDV